MITTLPLALAATTMAGPGGGPGGGGAGGAGMGPGGRQDQARSQVHRDGQGQPIYGGQRMTEQEREQYRERIQQAGTDQEREQIRAEHRKSLSERAYKRNTTRPDS